MAKTLINFAHWLDIKVFGNGPVYRYQLMTNGFFTALGWSDDEVLDYIRV